jgi:hypothetical protein
MLPKVQDDGIIEYMHNINIWLFQTIRVNKQTGQIVPSRNIVHEPI